MSERDGDPAGDARPPGAYGGGTYGPAGGSGLSSTWPREPREAEPPAAGPGWGEPLGTGPGDAGPHRSSATRRFLTLAVVLVVLVITALGLVLGRRVDQPDLCHTFAGRPLGRDAVRPGFGSQRLGPVVLRRGLTGQRR